MPVFHVSGGGSALQDALLSTVYNATNIFQIEDGIYNPLVFSSNTITANGGAIGYNTKFILSSVNGAENCIIDGGTIWENDEFGGTVLSGGKRCIIHSDTNLTPEAFSLSCCGITFRNGYVFNGSGAGMYFRSGINKFFYNCVIERCFCEVSASNTYAANLYSSGNASFAFYECVFKNIIGNRGAISNGGLFYNCKIYGIKTQYAQSIFESAFLYKCVIHDIDNKKGNFTNYSRAVKNCLFYNIPATMLFASCRDSIYGNTFALSGTYTGAMFSWNTSNKQIVANNVFSTGALASRLSGPEVIVMNNYARSFSGDASRLSGNIAGYDPLFADPVNLNFRLSKYSPCISAGNANWLSGYYSQYDLDKRRFKNPPSMGAYQFNIRNADMPNMAFPLGGEIERISELGYDAQVEYIESTGTQYIDSGLSTVPNTKVEFAATFRAKPNEANVFGSYYDTNSRLFVSTTYSESLSRFQVNSAVGSVNYATSYILDYDVLAKHTLSYEFNPPSSDYSVISIVDGTTKTNTSGRFSTGNSAKQLIFARTQSASSVHLPGRFRLHYMKIWHDGVLVRDFIPVRIGRVGYLYNKITKKLFFNSGNGYFLVGPDIQA